MYRVRIESLEKRTMFSAAPLVDLSPVLDQVPAIERSSNQDTLAAESLRLNFAKIEWEVIACRPETADVNQLASSRDLNDLHLALSRTESVGKDESISVAAGIAAPTSNSVSLNFEKYKTSLAAQYSTAGIVGDFNGDGRDDLASVLTATNGTIGPQTGDAMVVQGFLLPYMEQDNVYRMADVTDGTSNTIMFISPTRSGQIWGDPHINGKDDAANGIIAVLIGLAADPSDTSGQTTGVNPVALVDTSPIELKRAVASIDVWEHAYLVQPGNSTSGIIAVLIGLTVDPSDPGGNTYAGANFAMADGSVHFIGTDISGTASLLASDEFFSRFANTTFEDQALVATTYGRGSAASQITHDIEFEKWASASQFDRGYMSSGFYDLLVSSVHAGEDSSRVIGSDHAWGNHVQSILHEDNEFTIPRMITAAGFAKAN